MSSFEAHGPNVLLITADQHRFDAVGCNGNPHIRTPNLDRLAAEGVRFTNHMTSCPICTPARASILTGLHPRLHGAWTVGTKLDPSLPGLAHWLSARGYLTGLLGKAHLEAEKSNYVLSLDGAKPYYGFEVAQITEDIFAGPYEQWIRSEHPDHIEDMINNSHEDFRPNSNFDQDHTRMMACFASTLPEHLHQTAWIADRTIDLARRAGKEKRPFFAWCSFVDPHHPFNPPEPYASMYDPCALPPPHRRPGENEELPAGYCHVKDAPPEEYLRIKAHYYGMISHIDAHVGRILAALRQTGQLDNTIIVYTSDHGEYLGDHGLVRKGPWLYDNLLRVPMLVRLPGGRLAGRIVDELTQHEDIAPTLLTLLGMELPPSLANSFQLPGLNEKSVPPREFTVHYWPSWSSGGADIVAVRDREAKLTYWPGHGPWQLVDLLRDLDEYENIVDRPEGAPARQRLERKLLEWMLQTPHCKQPKSYAW